MFQMKLYKNGSSVVATVPKDYLRKSGLRDGSRVDWEETDRGLLLVVPKEKKSTKVNEESGLTPEFKKWLDDTARANEDLIKELAKR